MTRTIVDDTVAATFTFAGTWTTVTDANANGGTYRQSDTTTATTCTIAIPSGVTGVLVLGTTNVFQNTIAPARGSTVTITLDGTVVFSGVPFLVSGPGGVGGSATFTPISGRMTGVTLGQAMYKDPYPPVLIANPATTHTLVLSHPVSNGLTIDAVEFFTADTPTVGQLTAFGDTMVTGSTLGTPTTQRWSYLATNVLGMTEDNRGTTGQSLSEPTPSVAAGGWIRAASTDTWARDAEVFVACAGFLDRYYFQSLDTFQWSLTRNYYSISEMQSRYREMLWRVALNCPQTKIVHLTMLPDPNTPDSLLRAGSTFNRVYYSQFLDSVIPDTYNTFTAATIDLRGLLANTGTTDANGYPTADGNALIARELVRVIQSARCNYARPAMF